MQVSRLQIYYADLSWKATGCKRIVVCSARACLFVAVVVGICCMLFFFKSFLLCIAIALREIVNKLYDKIFQVFVNRSNLSELLLKLEICNLRQRSCLRK